MKKLLFWLLIIIVVIVAGGYYARNAIVGGAIEKGSAYALGVDAHLGSTNLSLSAGSLELNDYKLDNPPGYESPEFMSIRFGMLDISSGSVFSDTVVVDSLILDGISVTLIQRGNKGNFTDIMDYINKMDFDTSKSTTTLKINKVAVRNISVAASLKILDKVDVDKTYTIEDITLTNLGAGKGVTIGETASIIFEEILKKAVIKGKGQLSDQFGQGIKKLEESVIDKAGEDAVHKVKDIGGSLLNPGGKK